MTITYEYASVDHCTGHDSSETKQQTYAIDGIVCNIESSRCSLRHHSGYPVCDALRFGITQEAVLLQVFCIATCIGILVLKELFVLVVFLFLHGRDRLAAGCFRCCVVTTITRIAILIWGVSCLMVLRQRMGRHGQEHSPLLGINILRFLKADSQLEKSDDALRHDDPGDDPSNFIVGIVLV